MFESPDMIEQHNLLSYVVNEIDAGRNRTTLSDVMTPINAENIRAAHARSETGQTKGKIVVQAS
jgi:NADPH:quinone reductase-like Zn-dependent oxidoreductase